MIRAAHCRSLTLAPYADSRGRDLEIGETA